ncbi:MAG: YidC/Oxa1 family membrane protein insertase [Solirubrobacterales bacterium]
MIPIADILDPLENGAEAILDFFHDDVGLAWGTSIIALTVVIRTLLIPLTYKQIKGMRAMQALQPQIKELQEKYKNDRQRQQQEMMRFWQANKINPLASCLPLLLQLPVFFALFQLLQSDSFESDVRASGDQSWLFIDSVIKDPTGAEMVILVVLFIGSMALSSLVMIQSSPSGGGSQQYMLLAVFAVIGPFFVPFFPAGLSIYWITTNFWTVGQQYAAAKLIPPPQMAAPEQVQAAKPPPPPPRKRKKRR